MPGDRSTARRLLSRLVTIPYVFDAVRCALELGHPAQRLSIQRTLSYSLPTLDIGSGTGALADHFPPDRYLGVELNPAFVRRARQIHAAHPFANMDGTRLALFDGSFEQAMIMGVLHHCPDTAARAILAEALTRGGFAPIQANLTECLLSDIAKNQA